ncbi:MAG: sulfite exporter TauE/SafE family protein, partial [Anaerolineae bacterium]
LTVIAGGAGVGVLTGILGVGGGFLIVPALVILVGLPMAQAVGTSLLVIAMNSLAGFLGHISGGASDLTALLSLTTIFAAAGLVGAFTGARLAGRLPATHLRRLFGGFVIVLAIFLLVDNVPKV